MKGKQMRCTTPLSAGPSPPLCELLNSIHGGHGQGQRSFLGPAPPLPEPAPESLPHALPRATWCCLLGLGGRRRRGRPLRRRQAHGSDTETSPSVGSKPPCLACACSPTGVRSLSLQVDRFVKSGMVVGLGSGPASALAVQYLGTRLRRGSLTDIVAVTS